jgi:hypothetical protein
MGTLRTAAAVLAGVLLVGLVVRDAAVRSAVDEHPERARAIWADYPDAVIGERMIAIGRAAKLHRVIDDSLTAPVISAARVSPLSIEPFLVQGVKLQGEGREQLAGKLFLAAEQRDPRKVAPHLFLALHYSKSRQDALGLTELGKVIRLVPESEGEVSSRVALAMKQKGGVAMVRALVKESPELRDDVVRALATNADNLGLVLSLTQRGSANDWQPVMITSLLQAGQVDRAYALWNDRYGRHVQKTEADFLRDATFHMSSQPPFGWSLLTGSGGVAEPAAEGGLHLIYYGRDNLIAASQTLLLSQGRYILFQRAAVGQGSPLPLRWDVTCINPDRKIASIGFADLVRGGAGRAEITVPAGCPAQRIELTATAPDLPETLDVTISEIALGKAK